MSWSPEKVVASFDSASVLHASIVSALQGKSFSNLGNPEWLGRVVRVAGRLPWPVLREIYRRVGGAEGLPADRLDQVDLSAVARSFADAFPQRRYPAVMVGASNGAMAHLAAALQIPWLPQTVLVPVHRLGDPDRPDQALAFGRRIAPRFLEANPDVVLHQMHDSAQDRLMAARMAYFRVKWQRIPEAYRQFLSERLAPGAPVLIINDQLQWPVSRVDERHWFQTGGLGGLSADDHLSQPYAPPADSAAPEAEWGTDPEFVTSIEQWCADHDHPVISIDYRGPQQPSTPVAQIFRHWLRSRSESADTLIVPSFILGDPWRTLDHGLVPFWTYFPVQDAVASLERHLERADPYRRVVLLAFQHGVASPGIATAEDFTEVVRRFGAEPELLAVRTDKWPHDIGSLARYGAAFDAIPYARRPWSPMMVSQAVDGLGQLRTDAGNALVSDPARANSQSEQRYPDPGLL